MNRRIAFGLLWLGFVAYAFLLAPPDQPEQTLDLILRLSSGQWAGINPAVVALFNLMGVWPAIYAGLLLIDGRMQKIPAWPFVLGSFLVGAFALLPYLALRQPNRDFQGPKTGWLKLQDSRWLGLLLCLVSLGLLVYGLSQGDWSDFAQQWQTRRFIQVMSLDFCLLSLLFPALLGDDMARRGLDNRLIFWAVALIPLLGPALYLALRPRLIVPGSQTRPGADAAPLVDLN